MNPHFASDILNGDLLEQFLYTSGNPSEEDIEFLKKLTSRFAVTDTSRKRRAGAFQHLLKTKREKPLSEVLAALIEFAKEQSPLLQKDVSLLAANICTDAIENILSSSNSNIFLAPESQVDMEMILQAISCLIPKKAFHIELFSYRYLRMHVVPLQVLWLFHKAELVLFTTYVHHNRNESDVLDGIKSQLVTLLCLLSGDENMEGSMDHNGNESVMQEMARDLLSSLLCIAWGPGFLTLGRECSDILNAVLRESLEKVLEKLLEAAYEGKSENNFLECIASDPLLSEDIVERLFTLVYTSVLQFRPDISPLTALARQAEWTYNKTSSSLKSLLKCILLGTGELTAIEIIKEMIMREGVNWKLLLLSVSVYVKLFPDASNSMRVFVDSLLARSFQEHNKGLLLSVFLLARQCCAEVCNPAFPSYRIWFGSTFGSHSVWASHPPSQTVQEMLMELLSSLVPHEPPSFLRVHVNKPPCLQGNPSLLTDYNALAKTRLRDLNEAIGFGLFGPEMSTEQDIEYVLNLFEKSGGEVPQTLLDATVFRHHHYEQEFLPKLLDPRLTIAESYSDLREKLIKKLHSMGKISASAMSKYQQACALEKSKAQVETVPDDVIMEEMDPIEALNISLSELATAIRLDGLILKNSLDKFWELKATLEKAAAKDESSKPVTIEQLNSTEDKQVVDLILKWCTGLHAAVGKKLNLQWPLELLKALQPFRSLKIALLQRLLSWCFPLEETKVEVIVALVHGIEYLGRNGFPEIYREDGNISFATHVAELFPLRTSQEMEQCYRFAVQYMCYAEEYHILKETTERLQTVPAVLDKKYRFLSKRYSFADTHTVRLQVVTRARPHLWKDIMERSKISFNYWSDLELQIHPEKDFLIDKHQYFMDTLTRMGNFCSSNLQPLASHLLHFMLDLNHSSKVRTRSTMENHCCENFCREIVNVLGSLLERYPLKCDQSTSPWLLTEWLALPGVLPDDTLFFRIAESLPSWLLFTNSADVSPSEDVVLSVAQFINTRLKDTLTELDRGFLSAQLVCYLLNGLCNAAKNSNTSAEVHHLFSIFFETSPELLLASKVYQNEVENILQKHVRAATVFEWVLKERITGDCTLQHFGTALQSWRTHTFTITDKPETNWLFFLNMLTLSSVLESGDLQLIFNTSGVTVTSSSDLLTWLSTQVERNPKVLEVLDFSKKMSQLPYAGFSVNVLNSTAAAGLLFMLLLVSKDEEHCNKLTDTMELSTLFCRVSVHCLMRWKMAGIPVVGWKESNAGTGQRRGCLVPNVWLLCESRKLLYSVLANLVRRHHISLPQELVSSSKDIVLIQLFQENVEKR